MTLSRSRLWWVALSLCSVGWILLLPFYAPLPDWVGIALVALAAIVGIAASDGAQQQRAVGRHPVAGLAVAGSALAACWFLPRGLAFSLVVLSCGLLLVAIGPAWPIARRVSRGLLAIGSMALTQGATVSLYGTFIADVHEAPILTVLASGLLRILGRGVTSVGHTLFVSTATGPCGVLPTHDQLGLAAGLVVWVGFAALAASSGEPLRERFRRLLTGTGLALVYLPLRYILLLVVALETGAPQVFWSPTIMSLSFLPFLAFLTLATRLETRGGGEALERSAYVGNGPSALVGATALIVTGCLLGAMYLVPAGPRKEGTILFDEAHGEWESTEVPMTMDAYGLTTTYNYASLAEWLSYYYPIGRIEGPIDDSALEGGSVLVLKTPSIPYSQAEIASIDAFVRRGGGLFVLGDHTNVFGTTTALNPVLRCFGVALNYDSTYRLSNGSFTTYVRPSPCLDPIMQHVTSFDFLTSCTARAPIDAYRTMADNCILSNQADYSTRDFFPTERYNLQSRFGRFTQTVAVARGLGRVVAFTDSTCFSNFSVFMDGYPSFLLGTFAFLSRENARFPLRWVLVGVAAGALVMLGLRLWKRRKLGIAAMLVGILLGWVACSVVIPALHASLYPLAKPTDDIPFVYFDARVSDLEIEAQPASADSYDQTRQFDTLFVWTQRVQKIPQLVTETSRDEILPGKMYVVIRPVPDIDPQLLMEINSYVCRGATLILGDECGRDPRGLAHFLEAFGLSVKGDCGSDRVLQHGEVVRYDVSPSLTVSVSVASVEGVWVVLVSDSTPFSNLSLGGAFTTPSAIQRSVYDVWYRVLTDFAP
jgi:hypothetical protein